MIVELLAEPAVEPVTLPEVLAHLRLGSDADAAHAAPRATPKAPL